MCVEIEGGCSLIEVHSSKRKKVGSWDKRENENTPEFSWIVRYAKQKEPCG